jgi:hypothetical protein
MSPNDRGPTVQAETTEQALARVEAECDWSDVGRFAEAIGRQGALSASPTPSDGRERH